jgi:hypothetical protein
MKNQTKIVSISNWYYFFRVLISVFCFLPFFIFFWILLTVISVPSDKLIVELSAMFSVILCLIIFIGYTLYWKQSGIYINKEGDHIVKWGGWIAMEDKLLNGVIIANQVERGPIGQILNMATLTSGIFADRTLVGVNYSDIKNYDELMRSGNPIKEVSLF